MTEAIAKETSYNNAIDAVNEKFGVQLSSVVCSFSDNSTLQTCSGSIEWLLMVRHRIECTIRHLEEKQEEGWTVR